MTLTIGSRPWQLWLTSGYILNREGDDCLGLTQLDYRRMIVSDVEDPIGRRFTFFHEFGHTAAWELNLPGLTTCDQRNEALATIAERVLGLFDAQALARVERYLAGRVAPEHLPAAICR